MTMLKRGPSWFWIIFWMITIWPLGVYLLYKRLTSDRAAALGKDRKTKVAGWFLLLCGLVLLGAYLDGGRSFTLLLLSVFFLCGAGTSLQTAKRYNQDGGMYRIYIDAVANHGFTSIQDIASFADVDPKTAAKDLKVMIRKGYFDHAFIDERRGEIHYTHRQGYGGAPPATAQPYAGINGNEKMAPCRNCGANNLILQGGQNVCEFCGSPLGR